MRTDKQFYKCITLTVLLFTGFTAGSIAQDSGTFNDPEAKMPVILTTTPADDEGNVELNSVIEITFSSEMNQTTINESTLMLHTSLEIPMHKEHGEMPHDKIKEYSATNTEKSENSRQDETGVINGTISYSNNVAQFTPEKELSEGTEYTFTVTTGVMNSENIALESEYTWSFTTAGMSDPTFSDNQYFNQDNNFGREISAYNKRTADKSNKGKTNLIELGKAGQYVILAKTEVHYVSKSRITGHIGTGSVSDKIKKEKEFTDSARQRIPGQIIVVQSNQSDTTAPDVSAAIEDMMSAYSDASMQNGNDMSSKQYNSFQSGDVTPGVYEWSDSLHVTSDVTLSGGTDDVWIMMVSDNLTVDENTTFKLSDGARAENIYWYVEGEVTIGENAEFEGIILSMNEITLEKGAKLNGRMFSQSSITLDDNTVTEPVSMTIGRTSSANR